MSGLVGNSRRHVLSCCGWHVFLLFFCLKRLVSRNKCLSKQYWNYCDIENTIADSIAIAAFPINSDYCWGHYYNTSIVWCIVTSLVTEFIKLVIEKHKMLGKAFHLIFFPNFGYKFISSHVISSMYMYNVYTEKWQRKWKAGFMGSLKVLLALNLIFLCISSFSCFMVL